jgi:hypothetical protein
MQHSHKFMEQMDASKVRETRMIKGDFYVFGDRRTASLTAP